MRSGKLYCKNDDLIFEFLKNPNYEVRSDGTIWTRITKTGKISVNNVWRLSGTSRRGYRTLKYFGAMLQIHRIVYAKFHGVLEKDLVINHIDGNGYNNSIDNLELVTQSKNNYHKFRKDGGNYPVVGNKVLNWETVREIRRMKTKLQLSHNQLSANYGISKSHISQIINNEIWVEGKKYENI